jgi:hypothetical protein
MIYSFGAASREIEASREIVDRRSEFDKDNSGYKVYNTSSPDVSTVYKIAREAVVSSGAPVMVHARTDNNDVTKHDEDPDPTYVAPEQFYGVYQPSPLELQLKRQGVDITNKVEITFFRDDIFQRYGQRLLRSGDLLEISFNSMGMIKPKYYKVDNAQEIGNYRYMWLYLKCHATLISGDVNIKPDFDKTNDTDEDQ